MIAILILAHILGDYILQTDLIARWKARSPWGVVAHGAIVTAVTWLSALVTAPSWWPFALLLGLSHTVIDLVRSHGLKPKRPSADLVLFVLDQSVHVGLIVLTVHLTQAPTLLTLQAQGVRLARPRLLFYIISYLLLLNPAWILIRFLVRGIWGTEAAPHLGAGEKYGPMVERALMATCVVLGQFALVPAILILRRMNAIWRGNHNFHVLISTPQHWGETILSTLLALTTGFVLRALGS
jgi:hypothetical protein